MHCDSSSGWCLPPVESGLVKELAPLSIVWAKVVHVDQEDSDINHVASIKPDGPQNPLKIVKDCSCLGRNIESGGSHLVNVGTDEASVTKPRTRPGYKGEPGGYS